MIKNSLTYFRSPSYLVRSRRRFLSDQLDRCDPQFSTHYDGEALRQGPQAGVIKRGRAMDLTTKWKRVIERARHKEVTHDREPEGRYSCTKEELTGRKL